MSVPWALSILVAVAAVTYLSRAGMILFFADRTMPAPLVRGLGNVAPAVLAALAISLAAGGEGLDGIESAELAALVVAGVVATVSRNLTVTVAAGMVTLWIGLALG